MPFLDLDLPAKIDEKGDPQLTHLIGNGTTPLGDLDNEYPTAVLPGIAHNCEMDKYTNIVNLINQQGAIEQKPTMKAECLKLPGASTPAAESSASILNSMKSLAE